MNHDESLPAGQVIFGHLTHQLEMVVRHRWIGGSAEIFGRNIPCFIGRYLG